MESDWSGVKIRFLSLILFLFVGLFPGTRCTPAQENRKPETVYRKIPLQVEIDSVLLDSHAIDSSFRYSLFLDNDTFQIQQKLGWLEVPVLKDSIRGLEIRYQDIRIRQDDPAFLRYAYSCYYDTTQPIIQLSIFRKPGQAVFKPFEGRAKSWVVRWTWGCDMWHGG
jgi:hypothetical protein